jgi:hypothetical protein
VAEEEKGNALTVVAVLLSLRLRRMEKEKKKKEREKMEEEEETERGGEDAAADAADGHHLDPTNASLSLPPEIIWCLPTTACTRSKNRPFARMALTLLLTEVTTTTSHRPR